MRGRGNIGCALHSIYLGGEVVLYEAHVRNVVADLDWQVLGEADLQGGDRETGGSVVSRGN